MTQDTPPNDKPNWQAMAQDALDLWQSHLSALANNESAKDEMAKMMAPMNQMFNQWATAMQPTPTSKAPEHEQPAPAQPSEPAAATNASAPTPESRPAASEPVAPATNAGQHPAAPAHGDRDPVAARHDLLVQLAGHVADLDERIARIERLLTAAAKSAA